MNDVMGILVVLVAIVCMYLAQSKSTAREARSTYSFLGGIASAMIAVEAARRGEAGVCLLFSAAAATSAVITVLNYLKPTNPDA